MKIAFFTPLNPLKSGISDFSEELLIELSLYADIDIFIDDYTPTNTNISSKFKIRKMKEFENHHVREEYDEVIYQIGNNETCHEKIYNMALKYPGIIELHDVSLHHMMAACTLVRDNKDEYLRLMEYCHGRGALNKVEQYFNNEILPLWETDSITFTLNKEIIDKSKKVIVHSDFAKQMVKGIRGDVPVITIYLHSPDIFGNYPELEIKAKKELGIDMNTIIVASFGFASKPKRIIEIMEMLAELKKERKDFIYYIVGQCSPDLCIENMAKQLGIVENVIVTGFVDLDLMKTYMLATDICFNLRYPTQGESSAILHRMMGMGKCIFVTDIGSFNEYEDCIIKVPISEEKAFIKGKLYEILKNRCLLDKYGKLAFDFAKKNCDIVYNAKMYRDFIGNNCECDYTELLADKLISLNVIDNEIIELLVKKVIS